MRQPSKQLVVSRYIQCAFRSTQDAACFDRSFTQSMCYAILLYCGLVNFQSCWITVRWISEGTIVINRPCLACMWGEYIYHKLRSVRFCRVSFIWRKCDLEASTITISDFVYDKGIHFGVVAINVVGVKYLQYGETHA